MPSGISSGQKRKREASDEDEVEAAQQSSSAEQDLQGSDQDPNPAAHGLHDDAKGSNQESSGHEVAQGSNSAEKTKKVEQKSIP